MVEMGAHTSVHANEPWDLHASMVIGNAACCDVQNPLSCSGTINSWLCRHQHTRLLLKLQTYGIGGQFIEMDHTCFDGL